MIVYLKLKPWQFHNKVKRYRNKNHFVTNVARHHQKYL